MLFRLGLAALAVVAIPVVVSNNMDRIPGRPGLSNGSLPQ
jgi:hypothetical protein